MTTRRNISWRTLLKLAAGVLFALAVCEIGLLAGYWAGVFKGEHASFQHLFAEPRMWVGVKVFLKAALWLAIYFFADKRLQAALISA